MAEAELAQSRRQAEQTVVLAEADSKQAILAGRGEAQRIMQVGLSEAAVLLRKVSSYGDPRLYALTHVGSAAGQEHAAAGARAGVPVGRRRTDPQRQRGPMATATRTAPRRPSPRPAWSACCCKRCWPSGPRSPTATASDLASLKELTSRLTRETLANMPTTPPAPQAKEMAVAN